ncbi:Beta-glucosidase [Quillaja saponaria]|uniref:Beta-glucosidase n=1 Tax=Quillaja saponaria TaxID=32244 RepID=A0AAD7VP12_QUISA|nr:Beta-glucosidase [Quillaja saponaria]
MAFVVVLCLSLVMVVKANYGFGFLNRSSFPPGFIFGSSSSAYQYEGAAFRGGKGPSIWDNYTHTYPEKIADGSNGDVAVDEYDLQKKDIAIMKNMNLDAYRFSIAWTRILPRGNLRGGINRDGIEHYNNLINELIANDQEPFVTLFHWDVPQALEDKYGGFLSPKIVDDFRDYVDICFKQFGDRVRHWITLNEPGTFSLGGYASSGFILAPDRCSDWQNLNCTGGDSGTEPYLVTHHQLLAHAAAVEVYKTKYQRIQRGSIGITLETAWYVPLSTNKLDHDAKERALDFSFGWFMEPLTKGEYPDTMRTLVGKRLPKFTKEQSIHLIQSYDFIGLNYYTAEYVSDAPNIRNASEPSILTDPLVNYSTQRDGVDIGPKFGSSWQYIYPKGIKDILLYANRKYNNPIFYITEIGVSEWNNPSLSLMEALMDAYRIDMLIELIFIIVIFIIF